MSQKIPRIVLTGGPCAGKTTALCYLQEKLGDLGYSVFVAPEVPTLLSLNGINPSVIPIEIFERTILHLMDVFEKEILDAIKHSKSEKNILICDRGLMDVLAYIDRDLFQNILTDKGLTLVEARDGRYDAVFHLRSTAIGAEGFYTLSNNEARRESLEEARIADEKTLQAWNGHPHLRVIDNSTDFPLKLKKLLQEICHVLGIPAPLEIEKKFLLKELPSIGEQGIDFQEIDIEQFYVISNNKKDEEVRLRKRGQNGVFTFYRTVKSTIVPGTRTEVEEQVTEDEYNWSQRYKLKGSKAIKKKRFCFIYKNQYFELDSFISTTHRPILEIELTSENEEVILPPWIDIEAEVTENPAYSNRAFANQ